MCVWVYYVGNMNWTKTAASLFNWRIIKKHNIFLPFAINILVALLFFFLFSPLCFLSFILAYFRHQNSSDGLLLYEYAYTIVDIIKMMIIMISYLYDFSIGSVLWRRQREEKQNWCSMTASACRYNVFPFTTQDIIIMIMNIIIHICCDHIQKATSSTPKTH